MLIERHIGVPTANEFDGFNFRQGIGAGAQRYGQWRGSEVDSIYKRRNLTPFNSTQVNQFNSSQSKSIKYALHGLC